MSRKVSGNKSCKAKRCLFFSYLPIRVLIFCWIKLKSNYDFVHLYIYYLYIVFSYLLLIFFVFLLKIINKKYNYNLLINVKLFLNFLNKNRLTTNRKISFWSIILVGRILGYESSETDIAVLIWILFFFFIFLLLINFYLFIYLVYCKHEIQTRHQWKKK